jgi:FKBP-type peptidyl-prolyl cis-trans isomerase FkpA
VGNTQRVVALVIAFIFLATSIAGGIFVIIEAKKENETAKKSQQTQPKDNSPSNLNANNEQEEAKTLQGTKLADFAPVAKIDTLQKVDLAVGNGEEVKPGAKVTAHYTGAVAATGIIFQSSHDFGQPIPFSLSGVIKGWTDGVPGMKVGGKRRLLIPADQAYGANPPGGSGIPANADLVFDIELVAVEQ